MKVPCGLRDSEGQVARGFVHLQVNEKAGQEYGLTVIDNHSTCYVLVSPGDVITANIAVSSGTPAEFVDLVVDGILRNSWPNTRGQKVFTHIFERAAYSGTLIGETKNAKNYARMKVQQRNFAKDLPLNGTQRPSNVGSIDIQIFRKEATAIAPVATAELFSNDNIGGPTTSNMNIASTVPELGLCVREPDFEKYTTWQDLNRHIDSEAPGPSFEIGFFDGNKQYFGPKRRITHTYTGEFKLWASFNFFLRSTADLQALGFDVPLHYSPNPSTSNTLPLTAPLHYSPNLSMSNTLPLTAPLHYSPNLSMSSTLPLTAPLHYPPNLSTSNTLPLTAPLHYPPNLSMSNTLPLTAPLHYSPNLSMSNTLPLTAALHYSPDPATSNTLPLTAALHYSPDPTTSNTLPLTATLSNTNDTQMSGAPQASDPAAAQIYKAITMSPPPSAHKRKADSINGIDPNEGGQSPYQRHVSHPQEEEREGEKLRPQITTNQDEVMEPQNPLLVQVPKEVDSLDFPKAHNGMAEEFKRAEQHWEDAQRKGEKAQARIAAAEQQKKELELTYKSAIAVQKERRKVDELNQEAEALEEENAKLQAAIDALYHGVSL